MIRTRSNDYLDIGDLDDDPFAPPPAPKYVNGWLAMARKPFVRETENQCKRWRAKAIRLLARGNAAHKKLAAKLRCCTKSAPCNSEACASCMYVFRSRLFEQSVNVMPVGGMAVSIITAGIKCELGALGEFNVKKEVRRLQKRISRSDLLKDCLILGGLDVSLNRDIGIAPYWQVHVYILINHEDTKELRAAVHQTFPKEPSAAKPYRFRDLVDRLEAVGYTYKSRFEQRFHYINEETGNVNLADDDEIPDCHLPELLMFLDSYPIGERMLLRGIRRHGRNLNLKVIAK